MVELDIFTKYLYDPPRELLENPKNKRRWLRLNPNSKARQDVLDSLGKGDTSGVRFITENKDVLMFILRTFRGDDARTIQTGLRNHSIKFTNDGHIQCGSLTAYNPLVDPNRPGAGNIDSEDNLRTKSLANTPRLFHYSEDIAATENMKFILRKEMMDGNSDETVEETDEGDTFQYHLLYNPLHRKQFKTYYQTAVEMGADMNSFGQTEARNGGFVSMENLFAKYCSNIPVKTEDDTAKQPYAILDPLCHIFMSPRSCGLSWFFGDNKVSWDHRIPDKNAMKQLTDDPTYQTAISSSESGSLTCACNGKLSAYSTHANFVKNTASDSFMNDFAPGGGKLADCYTNSTINVCSIEFNADVIDVSGSEVGNSCGNKVPDPIDETPSPLAAIVEEDENPVIRDKPTPVVESSPAVAVPEPVVESSPAVAVPEPVVESSPAVAVNEPEPELQPAAEDQTFLLDESDATTQTTPDTAEGSVKKTSIVEGVDDTIVIGVACGIVLVVAVGIMFRNRKNEAAYDPWLANNSQGAWPAANKSQRPWPAVNNAQGAWPAANKSQRPWPAVNNAQGAWPAANNIHSATYQYQ
jgi:hypothetical protein